MATPSSDDVILPGSRKPCRACSDFKSWMRAPPGHDNSVSSGKVIVNQDIVYFRVLHKPSNRMMQ